LKFEHVDDVPLVCPGADIAFDTMCAFLTASSFLAKNGTPRISRYPIQTLVLREYLFHERSFSEPQTTCLRRWRHVGKNVTEN
jgi:hypothetical protein